MALALPDSQTNMIKYEIDNGDDYGSINRLTFFTVVTMALTKIPISRSHPYKMQEYNCGNR